jgi:hypothetical protein
MGYTLVVRTVESFPARAAAALLFDLNLRFSGRGAEIAYSESKFAE